MPEHKLNKTLGIDDVEGMYEELKVQIPTDPTLKDIANLALESYKDQMEDLIQIEPKNRQKSLEVACHFLTIAKDAIKQSEEIRLKDKPRNKDPEEEPEEAITRNELLKRNKRA